jgi:hypothetical protein
MEEKRDLAADLKLITIIPRAPRAPIDPTHDIIAPHALRRAIAAETALAEAQEARRKTISELPEELFSKAAELDQIKAGNHPDWALRSTEDLRDIHLLESQLAEAQQTIARMRTALLELPVKAVEIDSFADCDTISPFPMENPTADEQLEWFDEYCAAQAEYLEGLVADILEEGSTQS